jgi:hypothetical protein
VPLVIEEMDDSVKPDQLSRFYYAGLLYHDLPGLDCHVVLHFFGTI